MRIHEGVVYNLNTIILINLKHNSIIKVIPNKYPTIIWMTITRIIYIKNNNIYIDDIQTNKNIYVNTEYENYYCNMSELIIQRSNNFKFIRLIDGKCTQIINTLHKDIYIFFVSIKSKYLCYNTYTGKVILINLKINQYKLIQTNCYYIYKLFFLNNRIIYWCHQSNIIQVFINNSIKQIVIPHFKIITSIIPMSKSTLACTGNNNYIIGINYLTDEYYSFIHEYNYRFISYFHHNLICTLNNQIKFIHKHITIYNTNIII